MATRHATLGFQLLAFAAVLFIAAGLYYSLEIPTLVGFALTAAGFLVASSARSEDGLHWGRIGLGLLVAYVGMMPFFFEVFFPIQGDWYLVAFLAYLAGLLGTASGCFLALRDGPDVTSALLTRAGAVGITLAGLVWIPLGITGHSYVWTPGNFATFVGGLLILVGLIRLDPAPTAQPGPSKA